mgnify:CR=1 FL=1
MNYVILGTYQGQTEIIDTADTKDEARFAANEYRAAFGSKWLIVIRRHAA